RGPAGSGRGPRAGQRARGGSIQGPSREEVVLPEGTLRIRGGVRRVRAAEHEESGAGGGEHHPGSRRRSSLRLALGRQLVERLPSDGRSGEGWHRRAAGGCRFVIGIRNRRIRGRELHSTVWEQHIVRGELLRGTARTGAALDPGSRREQGIVLIGDVVGGGTV